MNYLEYIAESLPKIAKVPLRFLRDTYWTVITTYHCEGEKSEQVGDPKFEWHYQWMSPKMSITHKDIDVEVNIIEFYQKSIKIKIKYMNEFENEFLLYINETKSPVEIYDKFQNTIADLMNQTLMDKKGEDFFLEEEENSELKKVPFYNPKMNSNRKIKSIRVKKHFFRDFTDERIIDTILTIRINDVDVLKMLTNEGFMIYNGKDYIPDWNWNIEKLKTLTRKQLIDLYDYFVWDKEFYENYTL